MILASALYAAPYQYESQAWRIESENNGLARRYTPAGAPTQANGWTYFFSAAQPMLRPEHRTHPVLAQQDYTYDTFGNLADVRSGGSVERTFAYDGAQHLVEADLGGISTSYDYSVDNELMVEWRDGVRYQEAFEGWTNREGVVYEALLPFVTARDGELLFVLKEPDGRSNWIRRLDGTLLTDDNSGVYGAEWGLTVGGGWPLDEMHGGTRDSTDQLMHFGARHMLVEDGRWLQPEPLLYMGISNGDLTNPLGYGPVYARGNSNLYGDPTGEFAQAAPVFVGGITVAEAAVAVGVVTAVAAVVLEGDSIASGTKQGVAATLGVFQAASDGMSEMLQSSAGDDGAVTPGASQEGAANPARENKKSHIFGKPQHGLQDVVEEMGGEEEALTAIEGAVQGAADGGEIEGVFETEVEVGSSIVTVRGRVVDGAAKVGTAFIPEAGN